MCRELLHVPGRAPPSAWGAASAAEPAWECGAVLAWRPRSADLASRSWRRSRGLGGAWGRGGEGSGKAVGQGLGVRAGCGVLAWA